MTHPRTHGMCFIISRLACGREIKIGISPKLQLVWKGPYIIFKVISPILFEVADKKESFVLHHNRLKPCEDRSVPLWLCRKWNKILTTLTKKILKIKISPWKGYLMLLTTLVSGTTRKKHKLLQKIKICLNSLNHN